MADYPIRKGFTFSDVLIEPRFSDIESRLDIDVTSHYLGADRLPIMSAPMDYVTGEPMAEAMFRAGGYGVVNRFGSPLAEGEVDYERGLSVGIRDNGVLDWIGNHPSHSICVDVAHGHHNKVAELVFKIKETFPDLFVIAGNVATRVGYADLADAGADAVRVGIGPGSACSTRETTGVGVPQLTAILDVVDTYRYRARLDMPAPSVIADGGIQTPGDIAKALAAGASAVMLGRMLAGHDECPGESENGWHLFRGMSTLGSNAARGAPEGVSGRVEARGPVANTLSSLEHYLRSSMAYVGARNLQEFRDRSEFIEVSAGTQKESETRI